ncbi:MAG: MTH1187 family thiamine-binding protein [Thermoleophilaceae bacterium]
MATADLSIIPIGGPDASAGTYLAEVKRRLEADPRVRARMHATGTSLEGETADILAVVADMHAVPFELGLPRVYTILKLDERRDKPGQTLEDKERSLEDGGEA